MRHARARIVAFVFVGAVVAVAASCGGSSGGGGQPPGDAGNEDATTSCGGPGEPCCSGAACDNGLTCGAGTCSSAAAGDEGTAGDDATSSDAAAESGGDAAPDATGDGQGPDVAPDAGGDGAIADAADANDVPCANGQYTGPFVGNFTSHLTTIGIPIPIEATVDVTLRQEGNSDLFALQNGTISGAANASKSGDATVVGFPLACTMTGTLDCDSRQLVDGWIQCIYCVGPLADGGTSCSLGGAGGGFAGPVTASYDPGTLSFVMGTWNGAEALRGNDGGSPGPDGGPPSNYLSDAGYFGPGEFGGSGAWSATKQ
jgi:hypothetical protein